MSSTAGPDSEPVPPRPSGRDRARLYPTRPAVGVGVVVVRDGKVLLIRRARPPRAGEWSLPGGLQELGETVFAAAVREVREETGCRIRVLGLIDVVDLIERDPSDGRVRYHYTLVDVLAAWTEGEGAAASDAAQLVWVEPADLSAHQLWHETERILRQGLALWQKTADAF